MFFGILEPTAQSVYLPKDAKALIHGPVPRGAKGAAIDEVWLIWEASFFSI
jgi:hypothetical protein